MPFYVLGKGLTAAIASLDSSQSQAKPFIGSKPPRRCQKSKNLSRVANYILDKKRITYYDKIILATVHILWYSYKTRRGIIKIGNISKNHDYQRQKNTWWKAGY